VEGAVSGTDLYNKLAKLNMMVWHLKLVGESIDK